MADIQDLDRRMEVGWSCSELRKIAVFMSSNMLV